MSGFAPSFCGDGRTSRRFLGALTAVRMILEPRSPPNQKSWSSHTRASVGNVNIEFVKVRSWILQIPLATDRQRSMLPFVDVPCLHRRFPMFFPTRRKAMLSEPRVIFFQTELKVPPIEQFEIPKSKDLARQIYNKMFEPGGDQ